MKTFPDFTWEYIIERCERYCKLFQDSLDADPGGALHERHSDYLQSTQGLIAVVSQLRAHPQLGKLVPMMSLLTLRWFPAEDLEVGLYCEENRAKYSISVVRGHSDISIEETKVVAFDEVADEVYAFIARLRDDT